ncbi:MAG: sigma-70 family RNA polymerase sigma factor [Patescibacteria group bacterium]
MGLTESEIISRVQSGETEIFSELYEAYVRKIYAFIFYKTHHRESAEDLSSQTFLKALNKINSFDQEKGTFQAWLYQIARNGVTDHYRSLKISSNIEDVWDLSSGDDVARDASVRDQLAEVQGALQRFSPAQREIVILRVWEGLHYAEIAEIVGKSEAACKMDFSRTIKNLKKEIILTLLLLPLTF